MTRSVTVHTALADSQQAGNFIGQKIAADFQGQNPDVVLLFASARYDYSQLLKAINDSARPKILVGCSSAGEFINGNYSEGSVAAVAISSDEIRFNVSVGRNLRADRKKAAKQLVNGFQGHLLEEYPHRAALVLTDALAGEADSLIEEVITLSAGKYELFGGGAGDDAKFSTTYVFNGTEAIPDAVLALELLSKKPIGVGLYHGWKPASEPFRVTSAQGAAVQSLNSVPTVEVLRKHAQATGQYFDLENPMPFLMHNVFGIKTDRGYKIRVPMGIQPDGTVVCAAEVPAGSVVQLMQTSAVSSHEAAEVAIQSALSKIEDRRASVVLFFDCVATRFRSGQSYDVELASITRALRGVPYAGLNTYGQIARTEGQFLGFHTSTTVVCALPS